MAKIIKQAEFEQVVVLIEKSRNRAFSKVNAELVLLYFKVGEIVSNKVAAGVWGDSTVDDLAAYISVQYVELKGFNRRGLYRMKHFFESYNASSECFLLWLSLQKQNVSPLVTQNSTTENNQETIVSAPLTQLQGADNQHNKFVSAVLTQIGWMNHLMILSKTKTTEEKLYYLLTCIKERYSTRELERALNTAVFERTMMGNTIASAVQAQLPQNLFKDPYIFEFLDLPDGHSEKDFEQALILNLQKFILEIGKGFTYMGHQIPLAGG